MEMQKGNSRYSTNWGIRFLCDCRKENKEIRIHQGIAHSISTDGVHILSNHHICQQKKVAMQLVIPTLPDGFPQKVVKIIGHSINSIQQGNDFLTEIEFRHFEEDGRQILEKNLRQHFERYFPTQVAQRA